jgi:hypothetical protein
MDGISKAANEVTTARELGNQDDYPLECYEDGYPELPAYLDRRHKPKLAEAA